MLEDLPVATAAKLLSELPSETRQRVRREIDTLADVDPLERHRAMESFTASLRQATANQCAKQPTSLDFLSEITDDVLLGLLRDEHPQTKAVVLAEIPPARAAALLPRLGAKQRQDLLARIGRLPEVSQEMLSELAGSFRERMNRLAAIRNDSARNSNRSHQATDVDDAIAASQKISASGDAVSPRLQAILAAMPTAATDDRARDIGAEQSDSNDLRLGKIASERTEAAAAQRVSALAEQTHRELLQLSPAKLCESLGRVDTRTAILTLCGLPRPVADAAISRLPRSQANQVRQHLISVGSLEIREIDQALAAVAAAAQVLGHSPHMASATDSTSSTPIPNQIPIGVAM